MYQMFVAVKFFYQSAYRCLAGIILFAFGCTGDDAVSPRQSMGANYYPLIVGQSAIYEVEDIRYSLRDGVDTNRYQLREQVAETYSGAGGEIIYSLERYTRDSPERTWQLDSVWTARKDGRQVVVTESNVPYVKLMFPFQSSLQWDGNALNTTPSLIYTLTTTDSTLRREIGTDLDLLLDKSRTVVQRQLETLVNDSVLLETYAEDVGLIYKKSRILQYCADEQCIGQQIIESGRSYRQTLVAYDKE